MTKERIEKELLKGREQQTSLRDCRRGRGIGGTASDGRGCGEDEIH